MNVENGAEAALFSEKEYINEIFFAVYAWSTVYVCLTKFCINVEKTPNRMVSSPDTNISAL
jgi:hypothetical protein